MILRTVCDDVQRRGLRAVVFVTADRDHEATATFHTTATALTRRSLWQAHNALRIAAATEEQVKHWQQRLKLATGAASANLDILGEIIAREAHASYTVLSGTLGTVTGVTAARAVRAEAFDIFPSLGDVPDGGDVAAMNRLIARWSDSLQRAVGVPDRGRLRKRHTPRSWKSGGASFPRRVWFT